MSEKQEQVLDLSFFMPGKAEDVEKVKAPISKRFKDNNGNVIPFVFKAISTEQVDEIEKMSMKSIVRKNRVVGKEVDQARFIARVAVETTVYPDFKDESMRKAYKTEDPVEVAKRVLHVAGEYGEWLAKATEVNGFDDSLEDLELEAKN
ncbi:phage tail assembly chaperone [Siminovitchia terrae]|uniref:phage tail assembly chaperone n=1 Tax=Siminovitchia terrae TaxID=1914933 RepID=UPI0028A6E710|nr:phage portal protein [Siminovitchia terrae]